MTVFLFLLCAIAAILLMGGYYTYRIAFYSPKKGRDKISTFASHKYDPYRKEINRLFCQLSGRPYEEVSIVSFDGLTLFGRYYHVKDGAPLDIGFHGYRSSALTDFAGGSELSFSMGHNLLLIDERAHGRSEGRTITFGIQERWDVESWARFAVERFGADVQIILYGVSMGAATVLMAAGLDLPENVKGIIADCGFTSPWDIIKHVAKDRFHLPPFPLMYMVNLVSEIIAGFGLKEVSIPEIMKRNKIPVLFIHGDADDYVPMWMTIKNYEACAAPKELYIVPGAGHALAFSKDMEEGKRRIKNFINKYKTI